MQATERGPGPASKWQPMRIDKEKLEILTMPTDWETGEPEEDDGAVVLVPFPIREEDVAYIDKLSEMCWGIDFKSIHAQWILQRYTQQLVEAHFEERHFDFDFDEQMKKAGLQ